jgi:hypothetical protein
MKTGFKRTASKAIAINKYVGSNWVKVIDVDSFVFIFKSWSPSSDVIPTAMAPILRSAPLVG